MATPVTLTGVLADLIAFRTVSGDVEAAAECLDYLDDFLTDRGMKVTRVQSNGFTSMVATSQNTTSPKLILQAHLDVVPCPEPLYQLQEDGGKLVGRGAFDMKFAGAVFLKLVDDLKDEIGNYDFGLMLTFDEEIGGHDGVCALLKAGYRAQACILPDAGDNWHIEVTQKGLWIVKLKAKGVAVHGSRPWEGDNAIHRLLVALQEIQQLTKAQHAESDTLSINTITGGNAVNQVADYAEATLDIRFMNNGGYEKLSDKIEQFAAKHGLEIETIACIKPVVTDLKNPLVASFLKIAEGINGKPLPHINSLGNSDAHYFADYNIPVILMRPKGGAPHSNNEWIDKTSLEKYYRLIKTYVQAETKLTR